MVERRWPWPVSAVLLLVAGLATARSTYLWWQPCSAAASGVAGHGDDGACFRRMDEGSALAVAAAYPELAQLIGLALLSAAAAWLALVLGLRWSWSQRLLLAPLGLVLALVGVRPEVATTELIVVVDVAVVAAFVGTAIGGGGSPVVAGPDGVEVWRAWIPLGAVATFGMIWTMADHLLMGLWAGPGWGTPPGTGYLGAVVLMAAAVVTVLLAAGPARAPSRRPSPARSRRMLRA